MKNLEIIPDTHADYAPTDICGFPAILALGKPITFQAVTEDWGSNGLKWSVTNSITLKVDFLQYALGEKRREADPSFNMRICLSF